MLINLIGLKILVVRWTSWKKTSIRRPNLMTTRKEAAPRILLAQIGGRKTLKIIQNQKGTQIHVVEVEGTHVANTNKTITTTTINKTRHNSNNNINSNNSSHNRGT